MEATGATELVDVSVDLNKEASSTTSMIKVRARRGARGIYYLGILDHCFSPDKEGGSL